MKKTVLISTLCAAGVLVWLVVDHIRTPEIRNIILISMDTTRADHLSCYGYPKNTTPNIDAVAEQATRFEKALTPAPITLPAHSSMLTGLIPPAHGVHNNIGYQLAPSNITLAELLRENGFQTTAIVSAFVLDHKWGLAQGFDTYNDSFKEKSVNRFGAERKGDETTQIALDWLDNKRDRKSFLFLHYYDPHVDYSPPEPFLTKFSDDPYAGEIAFTDHCIGQVIQKLKDLDLYDSTLLIITGDHGEMLGEHGEEEHSYFIYESAIRVPLIIKLPGQKEGITVSDPVGLIDIVPTICSLLKIDPPAGIQGQDLSPLLMGEVPDAYDRFIYSESLGPVRIGVSSLMAISTDRWKYIQAPRPELYDLDADPGEEHNIVKQEPQRARILEDKLKEVLEQSVRTDPDSKIDLDPESIRRLESLGYIAGKAEGEIVFDGTKDDPKDFIHVFEQFNKALNLRDAGEYGKAEAILLDLIPERPDFQEIYVKLGDFAAIKGNYTQAVLYYRRVNQFEDPLPLPYDVYNDLAWIQATRPTLMSRDVQEAVRYAKKNCQQTNYNEPNALDTLATAYAAAGDFPKAVETARKAHALAVAEKDVALSWKIGKRLKLFEQDKPYIEE
ncbi:MAG: sulfatase-like hydrolase/transferase [Kiritimatiellaeota bacterium]|nr:sulfatase-like hydrolase/transferase [Kiritimatiellota bacterium]